MTKIAGCLQANTQQQFTASQIHELLTKVTHMLKLQEEILVQKLQQQKLQLSKNKLKKILEQKQQQNRQLTQRNAQLLTSSTFEPRVTNILNTMSAAEKQDYLNYLLLTLTRNIKTLNPAQTLQTKVTRQHQSVPVEITITKQKYREISEILISLGAEPSAEHNDIESENTALHYAAQFGRTKLIKGLAEAATIHIATMHTKNKEGKTPLQVFLESKLESPKAAKILIANDKNLLKIVYLHFGGSQEQSTTIFDAAISYDDAIQNLQKTDTTTHGMPFRLLQEHPKTSASAAAKTLEYLNIPELADENSRIWTNN